MMPPSRLTQLLHYDGSDSILANYTYTYDVAHRLQTETINGTLTTYSYDATDQLTNDSATTYTYLCMGQPQTSQKRGLFLQGSLRALQAVDPARLALAA